MRVADLDVFVQYRNDADTARFQFWDLPYTRERAVADLATQLDHHDLATDGWTQLAIDLVHPGITDRAVLIGDLAVGFEHHQAVATIGYTLAPAWRHRGFAREAVGALVDRLFTNTPVHRVVATLDPLNTASERLLVHLGFQREGIARQAFFLRGEWVDDLVYSLLRSDRPPHSTR
jgi:RimJ/RimL family protein N-acetyltransferase